MDYDQFRAEWHRALQESRLPVHGFVDETLDLRSMDRTLKSYVQPVGGQDAEPFYVTAELSWRWDALKTARTRSTEEDLLTELLGRTEAREAVTEQPWLRVDVKLHASLMMGRELPMPTSAAWAKWAREVGERLEEIEPLIPEEQVEKQADGLLAILAWKGEPELEVICTSTGELKLSGLELSAWQAILLPRTWDDTEREPDNDPGEQLEKMFGRVKVALHAWSEVLDHLR